MHQFSRLEIKRSNDAKALLEVKCNQFEDRISVDKIKMRDMEGKVKVLGGERASIISSNTGLQHNLKELQVKWWYSTLV